MKQNQQLTKYPCLSFSPVQMGGPSDKDKAMGKDDNNFQEQLEKLKEVRAPRDADTCMVIYCPGNHTDGAGPEITRPTPTGNQRHFVGCGNGYKKAARDEFLTDVL